MVLGWFWRASVIVAAIAVPTAAVSPYIAAGGPDDWLPLTERARSLPAEPRSPFVLEDEITHAAADGILHALRVAEAAGRPFVLDLNSLGGLTAAAGRIARALRGARVEVTTIVRRQAVCTSACVAVFLAAKERLAHSEAVFGFHRVRGISSFETGGRLEPSASDQAIDFFD